jgi:hypothetical protein
MPAKERGMNLRGLYDRTDGKVPTILTKGFYPFDSLEVPIPLVTGHEPLEDPQHCQEDLVPLGGPLDPRGYSRIEGLVQNRKFLPEVI